MSEDFGTRISMIRTAYSSKLAAGREFVAAWHKVSRTVVLPAMAQAKTAMGHQDVTIKIEDQENGDLVLTVTPKPIGRGSAKSLSYHPKKYDGTVLVTADVGSDQSDRKVVDFDDFSPDLVESHIETFLKNALRVQT